MRSETLGGVYILFSSVIPLDTRPGATEIWRMVHMFGARCSTELNSDIMSSTDMTTSILIDVFFAHRLPTR
jgi:hypothetical protein